MEYAELMEKKWPVFLYRSPGDISFCDVVGVVWHVGSEAPEGYSHIGDVTPVNINAKLEVWGRNE